MSCAEILIGEHLKTLTAAVRVRIQECRRAPTRTGPAAAGRVGLRGLGDARLAECRLRVVDPRRAVRVLDRRQGASGRTRRLEEAGDRAAVEGRQNRCRIWAGEDGTRARPPRRRDGRAVEERAAPRRREDVAGTQHDALGEGRERGQPRADLRGSESTRRHPRNSFTRT
jgi:hypothetical protein